MTFRHQFFVIYKSAGLMEDRMKTRIDLGQPFVLAVLLIAVPVLMGNIEVSAQEKFKPGERVECDTLGIGTFDKGTVLPYLAKDNPALAKDARSLPRAGVRAHAPADAGVARGDSVR